MLPGSHTQSTPVLLTLVASVADTPVVVAGVLVVLVVLAEPSVDPLCDPLLVASAVVGTSVVVGVLALLSVVPTVGPTVGSVAPVDETLVVEASPLSPQAAASRSARGNLGDIVDMSGSVAPRRSPSHSTRVRMLSALPAPDA